MYPDCNPSGRKVLTLYYIRTDMIYSLITSGQADIWFTMQFPFSMHKYKEKKIWKPLENSKITSIMAWSLPLFSTLGFPFSMFTNLLGSSDKFHYSWKWWFGALYQKKTVLAFCVQLKHTWAANHGTFEGLRICWLAQSGIEELHPAMQVGHVLHNLTT